MSPLQVVVAVFCLIAALFLGLYVLLLLAVQAIRQRAEQLETRVAHLEDDEPACRVCGCTDAEACWPGGCWWTEPDLCSACDPAVDAYSRLDSFDGLPHAGTSLEGDR